MTTKLAENIALIPLLSFAEKYGENYPVLIWDDENVVLIDAGVAGQTDEIIEGIAAHGFKPTDLTHILITHQDWDHIGCIMDLQQQNPAIKLIAHTAETPYLNGTITPIKLANRLKIFDTLDKEMQDRCRWQQDFYAAQNIKIDHEVEDGEVLPICGGIEIIHAPGHTPGHIVFLLKQSNIIVCGDTLNFRDGKLIGPTPAYADDIDEAVKSFEKIKGREPRGLVSYHWGYMGG